MRILITISFIVVALAVGIGGGLHYLGLDPSTRSAASAVRQGVGDRNAGGPVVAMPVLTAPVRIGPAAERVELVGTLLADEAVVIRPEITGRIHSLHFSEGQTIAEGQVLVTLDPAEYQAEVAQKEAVVRLWAVKHTRGTELLAKHVLSKQDYDEMDAALQEAQADLRLARARLDKATLRAPFRGILGLRRVSPGDYVDKGQDLVNLEAVDPIKVDVRVPERYAADVLPGQTVTVRVDSYPGKVYTGEIYAIDPRLDEGSRSIALRGRIPNPGGQLRPGMFVRAALALRERSDALWAPEQAIVPVGNDQFVFRVVEGKAALTKVEIGLRRTGEVEVKTGLAPDDVVITDGQMKISDGMPVTVVDLSDGPKTGGGSRG